MSYAYFTAFVVNKFDELTAFGSNSISVCRQCECQCEAHMLCHGPDDCRHGPECRRALVRALVCRHRTS